MLRALTIEYVLVAVFCMEIIRFVAPALVTPAIGWALVSVFALLVVRDIALTIHEESVISDVLANLEDDDDN